jgi:uncharacterized LabA/DUF88 family protein
MKQRVIIFVDYQNVVKRASDFFNKNFPDKNRTKHIDPTKLGQKLIANYEDSRELKEIRIYTGIPSKYKEPQSYSKFSKRIESWQSDPLVRVITRPLSYPFGWPRRSKPGEKPREKGIDVNLAIDFVTMAIRKEYEVGILFSVDTDLKPALEFVTSNDVSARAEVAAWRRQADHQIRLALSMNRPFCHWLTEDDYRKSLLKNDAFV